MKHKIYFNATVSSYFKVPFYNSGYNKKIKVKDILECSIISWDIDTKRNLGSLKEDVILLTGVEFGWWEYEGEIVQGKPDTEKWNNPTPKQSSYDTFMKGGGLFI
jgi:hypothetical protein